MKNIKPYLQLMRLDKPIGIGLLLWPTLWALWFASHGTPTLSFFLIFIVGAFIMRTLGCVINDLADRHIDLLVKRTENRPLAQQTISVTEAVIVIAVLSGCALVLLMLLNTLTQIIALIAFAITVIYPFSKRWMPAPQIILGLAFSCSVPLVFAAVQNELPWQSWVIYVIALLWPIAYDTEYALVDIADDQKIGVKSLAIFLGKKSRLVIGLLQAIILLLFGVLAYCEHFNNVIFGAGLATTAALFAYQQMLIKNHDPKKCHRAFLNNNWVGLVLFIAILLSFEFPGFLR